MKTKAARSVLFLCAALATSAPALRAAEEECAQSLVLWEPTSGNLARDGMLVVRLRGGVRELGPMLDRSSPSLINVRTGSRVPLERVDDVITWDGAWGLHLLRPARALDSRATYRFETRDPKIRGLGTTVRTSSEFARRIDDRPPRLRKVHPRDLPAGTDARAVVFEGRNLPDDAWILAEIEEARDAAVDAGLDVDFPTEWDPAGVYLAEALPGRRRGTKQVVLSGDPCSQGVPWKAGSLYRVRFALLTANGSYMGPDSRWIFFRAPSRDAL